MRSTPVCLLQKEPCGTRESVHGLHTLEGLFSSAFGEKQMSSGLWRGTKFNGLHLSEDGKRELLNKTYCRRTYATFPS